MRGYGSQWISYKMNFRHPRQLKKWKSWEPFWSYQLNSTANPAHLPQNWAKFEVNGLDWQCCLAGSSTRAPRIFIFSIVLGAEYSFYATSIATYVPKFFGYSNSVSSIVFMDGPFWCLKIFLFLFPILPFTFYSIMNCSYVLSNYSCRQN